MGSRSLPIGSGIRRVACVLPCRGRSRHEVAPSCAVLQSDALSHVLEPNLSDPSRTMGSAWATRAAFWLPMGSAVSRRRDR